MPRTGARATSPSRRKALAWLAWLAAGGTAGATLSSCSSTRIGPTIYCRSNRELQSVARDQLYLLSSEVHRRRGEMLKNKFVTEIVPVPADGVDPTGVPYYFHTVLRTRIHGAVVVNGKRAKLLFPVMHDGSFHIPTLRHELLHLLLKGEGIDGHPPEYRHLAFRWRSLPGTTAGLAGD